MNNSKQEKQMCDECVKAHEVCLNTNEFVVWNQHTASSKIVSGFQAEHLTNKLLFKNNLFQVSKLKTRTIHVVLCLLSIKHKFLKTTDCQQCNHSFIFITSAAGQHQCTCMCSKITYTQHYLTCTVLAFNPADYLSSM